MNAESGSDDKDCLTLNEKGNRDKASEADKNQEVDFNEVIHI